MAQRASRTGSLIQNFRVFVVGTERLRSIFFLSQAIPPRRTNTGIIPARKKLCQQQFFPLPSPLALRPPRVGSDSGNPGAKEPGIPVASKE